MGLEVEKDGEPVQPKPDDEVLIRFGDLLDMQRRVDYAEAVVGQALENLAQIARGLGIKVPPNRELSAAELVQRYILPKIDSLMVTKGLVAAAESDLRKLVAAGDAPVMDLGNGQKAVRVGQRLPPGMIKKTPQR